MGTMSMDSLAENHSERLALKEILYSLGKGKKKKRKEGKLRTWLSGDHVTR